MHANRNKGALKRVEKGMMKANRTRNLFAILAIILTTFMITTVFSLGINYKENAALMQIRMAGTTAQVSLSTPTPAQEQAGLCDLRRYPVSGRLCFSEKRRRP